MQKHFTTLLAVLCLSCAVVSSSAAQLVFQAQPSSTAIAGFPFAQQPVIRIENGAGNVVSGDNATWLTATVATGRGTLLGSVRAQAVDGVVTFSNLSYTIAESITIRFSGTGFTSVVSDPIQVQPAAPSQLRLVIQPSRSSVAGVPFSQQPAVQIEDAYRNLVRTDNLTVVTASIGTGPGSLSGEVNVTARNGIVQFSSLNHEVTGIITLSFSAPGLPGVASGEISITPAPIAALAFTTDPANGRANEPLGMAPVVQTQDRFGNASLVGLPANLPVKIELGSGSGFVVGTTELNIGSSSGNGVVSFADLQIDTGGFKKLRASAANLTAAVSRTFVVAGVDPAATTVAPTNGGFATLEGPTYYEAASGNVSEGTIILRAPQGFEFDTAGSAPTVLIERIGGIGNPGRNINDTKNGQGTVLPVTSRSATEIVFTVTATSTEAAACSMTWQDVRVRAWSGPVIGAGDIHKSGTAALAGVQDDVTSFGLLLAPTPRPTRLAIVTQPAAMAVAGVPFSRQPVVRVEDQFGGLWARDRFSITATRSGGSGVLQGATTVETVGGLASFTNLTHETATNITVKFSRIGLFSATSSPVFIEPAVAESLAFTTQPAEATRGQAFGVQPVVKSVDAFGNASTRGVPSSLPVSVALTSGSGNLSGGNVLDIGSTGGNGVASFGDLAIDQPGLKQLTATAPGFGLVQSEVFTVKKTPQTITFPLLPTTPYTATPMTISAEATSGLPVQLNVVSGPAIVSGNLLRLTGTGLVTLRATQPGNSEFEPALPVQHSFEVTRAPQMITFASPGEVPFRASAMPLSGNASSGLPISYTVVSGPATVASNALTLTGTGVVTVRATQAGDRNYLPAEPVEQSFTVIKGEQVIAFPALPNRTYGEPPFSAGVSASSGLAVALNILSGPATINGNVVTITGVGVVSIRAVQQGNSNYNAAVSITNSFVVNKAAQAITFGPFAERTYGEGLMNFTASSSSGLPPVVRLVSGSASLSYTVPVDTSVATGTLLFLKAGDVVLQATQPGNANYLAAPEVLRTITIKPANLTVIANNATRAVGAANPAFSGTILGLRNNDNITASYTTVANSSSPEGDYEISITLNDPGLKLGNYVVTLQPGVLTVVAPPTIVSNPQPAIVIEGGTALFHVAANGSGSLAYQWRLNGSDIPGATGSALVLANARLTDAGSYSVAVSNQWDTVTSESAALNVNLAGDYNGDAKRDLLVQAGGGLIRSWFLDGATISGAILFQPQSNAWKMVSQADFNGDAKADFLFQNNAGAPLVWFMDRTNYLGSALLRQPAAGWSLAGTADFNRDGQTDLLWQRTNGVAAIWLMSGTTFVSATLLREGEPVATGWRIAGVADLTGDRASDILWQHADGRLVLWHMNGLQFSRAEALRSPVAGWQVAGLADFDMDGQADILYQNTNGSTAIWYLDGTRFVSASLLNGALVPSGARVVGPR